MPTANQRVDQALATILRVAGQDEMESIRNRLTPATRQTFGALISIGGFRGVRFSSEKTERRALVRAVLLGRLALNHLQSPAVAASKTHLLLMSVPDLERQLRHLFPFKPYQGRFGKRSTWDPIHFTDPLQHNDGSYMYLVHTIMGEASKVAEVMVGGGSTQQDQQNFQAMLRRYIGYSTIDRKNPIKKRLMVRFYEEYLKNPAILRKNIVSSSVISHAKHATYYPFGLIMRVPQECIYITSPSDVGVANRTSDILAELQDKQQKAQSQIYSPQEILQATTGADGDTGYNEVVVIGTAPEGKQVEVTGIFVKTDGQGNLFMRNGLISKDVGTPYVNEEIQQLIKDSSLMHKVPIVPIADTSSGVSTTPWPFGEVRAQVYAPTSPSRPRSYSV